MERRQFSHAPAWTPAQLARARSALIRRLVGNVQELPREKLLRKIEQALSLRECEDMTVRELEDMANRMLRTTLRDYHAEVSYA